MEAGKLTIDHSPFSIQQLMTNIQYIVSTKAEAKNLEFDIRIDPDLPDNLIGDAQRIHQILANLADNAIKYTDSGAVCIELHLIELHKKIGRLVILGRVVDTGIGISEIEQKSLFSSFLQTDENSPRHTGSTGLGLSISRQLIEMMGGELTVTSAKGKGSCFEFTIECRIESRSRRNRETDTVGTQISRSPINPPQ